MEVQPKLGLHAEQALKTEGGIRRHAALTVHRTSNLGRTFAVREVANTRTQQRNTHAILMTTFPVARPDSEYASASRSGLTTPLSTSRVISLSCSPSARTKKYS